MLLRLSDESCQYSRLVDLGLLWKAHLGECWKRELPGFLVTSLSHQGSESHSGVFGTVLPNLLERERGTCET